MSIKVMNLVWQRAPVQSGELLMLLVLADNADDKGTCYPGVPYLARKARMSERNVQLCLRKLADAGYVKVFPNRGPSGVNMYCVDLGLLYSLPDDFVPAKDEKGGENISPPKAIHPVKSATEGVKNEAPGGEAHFTQTVIEPSVRTSQDAQAREGAVSNDPAEELPTAKGVRRLFQRLVNNWPNFAGMSLDNARREFDRLTAAEQAAAVDRRDPWIAVLRKQGKDHTPAPSTYIKERLWEAVPSVAEAAPERTSAAPFGKAWMNHVLTCLAQPAGSLPPPSAFLRTTLEAGGETARRLIRHRIAAHGWPHVNRIYDRAADGLVASVPSDEVATMPDMEALAVDSPAFDAWRCAFHDNGWPWPKLPAAVKFVWFPKNGLTSGPLAAVAAGGRSNV